jgi:hypothetical protein
MWLIQGKIYKFKQIGKKLNKKSFLTRHAISNINCPEDQVVFSQNNPQLKIISIKKLSIHALFKKVIIIHTICCFWSLDNCKYNQPYCKDQRFKIVLHPSKEDVYNNEFIKYLLCKKKSWLCNAHILGRQKKTESHD